MCARSQWRVASERDQHFVDQKQSPQVCEADAYEGLSEPFWSGSFAIIDCCSRDSICSVRKWWNWQTHHLEGVAPKGVGVQIPPSAPSISQALGAQNG